MVRFHSPAPSLILPGTLYRYGELSLKQHAAGSTPALAATERFAAIVEPVRRLVANEEIAGAEPAGRSNLPTACRSKADRPLDKGQTVERYHARRPSGGRRQRDEPSGCDPELSRCESGRSPQRFRAQGKTASRQLGVLEERRASRRSPTSLRPRRSTADRFRDMEETEVRPLSWAPDAGVG